jgi:hypothetical protein
VRVSAKTFHTTSGANDAAHADEQGTIARMNHLNTNSLTTSP